MVNPYVHVTGLMNLVLRRYSSGVDASTILLAVCLPHLLGIGVPVELPISAIANIESKTGLNSFSGSILIASNIS